MDNDFGGALASLGVPAPGAPAAPSITQAAAPTQRAPSNNFGNIRPQGASTGFQKYDTPEAGLAAVDSNLKAYGSKGINTISGVISRWAPPSENNTPAYIADVSKRLGIAPDAQIDLSDPFVRHALTTAITLHEHGPKILTTSRGQAPQPTAAAQPAASQPVQADSDFAGALASLTQSAQAQPTTVQAAPQAAPTTIPGGGGASGSWAPGAPPSAPQAPAQPTFQGSPVRQAIGDAGAGALGIMHGIDNTVAGALQFGAHAAASAYPKNWAGSEFLHGLANEADKQIGAGNTQFTNATKGHEQAASIGETTGAIEGGIGLPAGKLAEGANLVNKLIYAGKTGAVAGAVQAVDPSETSYWKTKAEQTALGAAGGVVGTGVAAAAGKVAGAVMDRSVGLKNMLGAKFGGAAEAPASVAASVTPAPGSVAGAVPSATAAQPAANASVADLMKSASPELKQSVQAALKKGEQVNPAALARQVEAQNLPVPMSLTKGQASQEPALISTERNMRSQNPAIVDRLNDQNTQLVQNLNHIRDKGAPDAIAPDHITAAETLIGAGQKAIDAQQAKTSALYKQLTDANGGTLPLDGKTFATQASQALEQKMKSPFLPGPVQGILSKFENGDQPMTFTNFENLRTILAAEGRKAARSGDGNAAAAISTVRDTLENMPMDGAAASIKPLADAARASARQGFQMIESTPMLKAIDSGGASSKNLIEKYVIGANNRSDLINMANALKDDPVALQTMKAGTINYLKSKAGITSDQGNFTQNGYNNALKALGPKLDVLFSPVEAAQLRAVGNVARHAQAQPTGAYVNNSNTDVARLARAGAGVVERGIDTLTGSPLGSIGGNVVRSVVGSKQSSRALIDLLHPGAGTTTPNEANKKLASLVSQINPASAAGTALAGSQTSQRRP